MHPPGELKLIYAGCEAAKPSAFVPSEWRYPGSKASLLGFLERVVQAKAGRVGSFADLLAGSGCVAFHFASAGAQVTANDLRPSSYVTNCAFLLTTAGNVDREKLRELVAYLAALPPRGGPLARLLAPALGAEAAGRLQAARSAVAALAAARRLTGQEEKVLVAALVQAADRLLNGYRSPGLPLRLPRLGDGGQNAVYQTDACQLVREVEAEVLYLDLPVGAETGEERLALLDALAAGGERVGPGTATASRMAALGGWGDAEQATARLADLVARARCRHLLVSYSSAGVIPNRVLWDLLKTRGRPECFEFEHRADDGAGRVVERLFYCAVKPDD